MAALTRLGSLPLRLNQRLLKPLVVRTAGISTSKKNKDTVTVTDVITERTKSKTEASDTDAQQKNWVSWGFDQKNIVEDNTSMHLTFFVGVTLCIVVTGFFWTYLPDYKNRHWAQREAFLELRRREALGLPAIDANLVAPENIELPSDEELAGVEIII